MDQLLPLVNASTVTSPRDALPGKPSFNTHAAMGVHLRLHQRRMGIWEDQKPPPGPLCSGGRGGMASAPLETAWLMGVIAGNRCAEAVRERG